MKKKGYLLTSLLLSAVLSIGFLCGCGNTASEEGNETANADANATEAVAEEPTTAVA